MKNINVKHVTLLLLYTIIIFIGSFLIKNLDKFEFYMTILLVFVFLGVSGYLLSGTKEGYFGPGGEYFGVDPNPNYLKARQKDKPSYDFISILGCLYIVAVPLLALYLFG